MVSNFECGICASDVVELRKNCVLIAGQDKICSYCFQHNPLQFQEYRAYLSDDDCKALITGYEAKKAELETTSADRVCHEDGTLLGSKPSGDSVRDKTECPFCKHVLCMLCGRRCPREGQDSHVCRKTSLEDAYKDKQKGSDYQICPTCNNLEEQASGCNTLSCSACRTSCCFICGEAAAHNSDHWKAGKPCARFGRPGTTNAIFDGQGTEIVHDAFVPEAVGLRLQVVVATSRAVLRPLRDMIHHRYLRDGSEVRMTAELKELVTDFHLMLQNMITNLGALDFAERGDIDFERWRERHRQVWGFLDKLGGVEMINRLQGLWEVWKTYAGIEIWVEGGVIRRARLDVQEMNRFTATIAEMRFE